MSKKDIVPKFGQINKIITFQGKIVIGLKFSLAIYIYIVIVKLNKMTEPLYVSYDCCKIIPKVQYKISVVHTLIYSQFNVKYFYKI